MAAGEYPLKGSIPRFSRKSKGGATASRVEHQDSVGSVLALESIGGLLRDVPANIIKKQGYIGCEWDQDLEVHWPTGVLLVQVKDQILDLRSIREICADFEELTQYYAAVRGSEFSVHFRIEALAGLATSTKSLSSDLEHLERLPVDALKRDSATLLRDFSHRWGIPVGVARELTISSRDLRRDSVSALAVFAHLVRRVYPVHDYTDAGIMKIWDELANGHFAHARRNRAPVMIGAVEESVLRPLMPLHFLRYEAEYVRTSFGYVFDPVKQERLRREAELLHRALEKAMAAWRRHTRKDRILNLLYRSTVRCPACNTPMMANWAGRSGLACADCGYSPYLTLVYVCDCEDLIPIIEQPEITGMGIFGDAVRVLRSSKITCAACGFEPRFEQLHTRLVMVPIPFPVSKFSEQGLVDIRVRLGWQQNTWPFTNIAPIDKMLLDDEEA